MLRFAQHDRYGETFIPIGGPKAHVALGMTGAVTLSPYWWAEGPVTLGMTLLHLLA